MARLIITLLVTAYAVRRTWIAYGSGGTGRRHQWIWTMVSAPLILVMVWYVVDLLADAWAR